MAEREVVGDVAGHRDVYYCFMCQTTVAAAEPELICPDCSNGFIELLPPGMNEPDHGLFDFAPQSERNRVPSETDVSFHSSNEYNAFDVESVTDLIGRMHYDALYDDHVPSRAEIPAGYTPDDAVMDPFEWDRILSWFFENGSAFLNGSARLSEEQIENIPVSLLKAKDIEKTSTCPICIDDFKLKEEVKILHCKHFFHKECIVSWLKLRANCPVCRENVEVAEEHSRSFGMVLRVPERETNESLRESAISTPNNASCLEDNSRRSVSGIHCDFSNNPGGTSESASSSSGIPSQNRSSWNQPVCNRRRASYDAHASQHHSDTNRSDHTSARSSSRAEPSERASRRRALYNPNLRNYSAHLPSDGLASRRSAYSLSGGHLSNLDLPYTSSHSPGTARSASYAHQPLESDSASYLRYQTNSSDSSFDSNNRHRLSNSSSLEDLSSVVPVIPPNIIL